MAEASESLVIIVQIAVCADPVTGQTLVGRAAYYVHTARPRRTAARPIEVRVVREPVHTPTPSQTAAARALADIDPAELTWDGTPDTTPNPPAATGSPSTGRTTCATKTTDTTPSHSTRGHLMTTVTIDLANDTTAAASVRDLAPADRDRLQHALRAVATAENEAAILAHIREVIAEEYPWINTDGHRRAGKARTSRDAPTPIGVVFTTTEWDDGFFLSEFGDVLLSNGRVDEGVDFAGVDDLFTAEFGQRSSTYAPAIDLVTGKFDTDGHAEDSIHDRLGIPEPTKA